MGKASYLGEGSRGFGCRRHGPDFRRSMEKGQAQALVFPPPLRPGDTVAVVAPSSPPPRGELDAGIAWLRRRYRVEVSPRIDARQGYLAGDDATRAAELAGFMLRSDVRAVVAARGGYGLTRIVASLPWQAFAAEPRWLVGFSDVTALHAFAWRHGVASVHGPNVTGLGREGVEEARAAWIAAVEAPHAPRAFSGLRAVAGPRDGVVEGLVVGGNVALLETLAAQGALALPPGALLALEDVGEPPYRLDRMLTALLEGGHLRSVAAVVLGSFERCDPGADGVTAEAVLVERLGRLGVPVVAGAPFGHHDDNRAFVQGAPARLDLGAGALLMGGG